MQRSAKFLFPGAGGVGVVFPSVHISRGKIFSARRKQIFQSWAESLVYLLP